MGTVTLLAVLVAAPVAPAPYDDAYRLPAAIVDLADPAALASVAGSWRYRDASLTTVDARAPGPDLRASGKPVRSQQFSPRADDDDSKWEVVAATALEQRRGNGKVCFGWYRLTLNVPERIGTTEVKGGTLVFEVVVDDYAEVWVDGKLSPMLGQSGGAVVRGFNAPNRVVLTREAKPGQQFRIAVFAANGPLSIGPDNFLWIRSATLELHRPAAEKRSFGSIARIDPALDELVPADARIEKLAEGFEFIEGPVWHPDGYLLFSDPNANRIYRWTPDGQVSVYRTKSGYKGADVGEYHQPGSNGLTLDREGRLTVDEHGNRRVTRLERTGALTILADRYQGKRLNSPNDLVYRSDGALYFTDPPFGLPRVYDDPRKELPYSGVFCLKDGGLKLVSTDLIGPNGIAFSPDEKFLYVTNWDPQRKVVMRYQVAPDCGLSGGRVFFDMSAARGEEALDGMKVDQRGNLYVSGPGGVWIVSAEGKHLGTIVSEQLAANMAWGDSDGRTLYLAARSALYRIRLSVPGIRPGGMVQLVGAAR